MAKAAIFLGGELSAKARVRRLLADADHFIAADSGARHARELDLPIQHLVGDLDSIEAGLLEELRVGGVRIHQHPVDKNQTDKELAIELARQLGADEIHLVGNEGGRVDHLLAGITILGRERYRGLKLWLHGAGERLAAIRGGESLRVGTAPGRRVSLIALSILARGVDLTGVRWPLKDQTLELGSSLTISNCAEGAEVYISVREGTVIVCFEE